MLHSMLFVLFAFVPLADVVITSSNDKDLPDVQTHLPDWSLRNIPAVSIENVRSSQLFGGSDEATNDKRSVGAVKRSHFKGLVLSRDQWASRLWPRGEVPYEISPKYNFQERNKIQSAMDAFRTHTCIRFRPRTLSDMYYISISDDFEPGKWGRCWSYIGRQTDEVSRTPEGKFETKTNLHRDCFTLSTLLHELMHAIGFYHEHQRDDRNPLIDAALDPHGDDWYHQNRKIYPRTDAYYMGSYDPESIMHYPFPNLKKHERQYFSQSDINNINKLYNCSV